MNDYGAAVRLPENKKIKATTRYLVLRLRSMKKEIGIDRKEVAEVKSS